MKKLTTFEDIFNKLVQKYEGETVEISSKQNGVNITSITTTITSIKIKPLNKRQSRCWNKNGKKVGLIILKGRNKRRKTRVNIPFLLGFNTMEAVFLKNGATIKTYTMEFTIKKDALQKRNLA